MRLQVLLTIFPFASCALLSPIAAVHFIPLLATLYIAGMTNINRELNADYVAMIEARIKNRRRSLHCSLTGLPNRAFFQQSVAAALDGARTHHRSITIFCLDLDGFKSVNDGLGHPMGDVLLKLVARRIEAVIPEGSMPARLGGDEFAILVPNADRLASEAFARTLIASLRDPFTLGGDVVRIGIAAGGYNGAETFDHLFENADGALYAAKRAGKGTFRCMTIR